MKQYNTKYCTSALYCVLYYVYKHVVMLPFKRLYKIICMIGRHHSPTSTLTPNISKSHHHVTNQSQYKHILL